MLNGFPVVAPNTNTSNTSVISFVRDVAQSGVALGIAKVTT